jgi:4-hydroxy-tetrahydrodipicolinate reductase
LIGKEIGKLKVSSNLDGLFLIDVFIDFTVADASFVHLDYVARYKKPLVLGTTGFTQEQLNKVEEVSRIVPVVFSPNMSIGVNVLLSLVGQLAKKLGPAYGIEITEAHHSAKKDAPSGTAKKFAEVLASATGKKDIPVHAIRLGDIIGDHTIIFCGNSERIEIKHQAHSRELFAAGALAAAKWVIHKEPGLYSMQDVLGMNNG